MVHEDSVTVPFDLTQDGIANVVGIRRAHVSVELKKLQKENMLIIWKSHMLGCSSKRLAYILSSKGLEEAADIDKNLRSRGIDPELLLDMKRCNPGDLWNSLNEDDRDTIGIACTFRVPVPRSALPPTTTGTMPIDINNMVSFPQTAARNYLTFADPARQRRWHSAAADYWINNDNVVERLYHLIMAGRTREAVRCICLHAQEVSECHDASLLKVLKRLDNEDDGSEQVRTVAARIALDVDDPEYAVRIVSTLRGTGNSEWMEIEAEGLRKMHRSYESIRLAQDALETSDSPFAAIVAAEAYSDIHDYEKAGEYLRKSLESIRRTGDARYIDRWYLARARTAAMTGDGQTAAAMCERARNTCPAGRLHLVEEKIKAFSGPVQKEPEKTSRRRSRSVDRVPAKGLDI